MHLALLPGERRWQDPDAVALTDDRHPALTNARFDDLVIAAARRLAAHGVTRGCVVATKLPNRIELVVVLFAAWRLGAALTPINPALTEAETAYQLADSGAAVLVCDDAAAGSSLAAPPVVIDPTALDAPGALGEPVPDLDEPALIIYTSGTTGRPKGVVLTHANLDAMTASAIEATAIGADDHCLLILPLFHVNGIVVSVLTPLRAGGRTTIVGRFSASTFFAALERARPTYFSGVPAIFAMLADLPADAVPDTSSLRFALCGAAPMPPQLIGVFERRYGVALVEGYGLSEATCASTLNPVDGPRRPGTVGVALPGHTVAIMGEDGELVIDGGPGEVVVAGPTVMRGYLGRPAATAEAVRDGWLHTGDVGRLDADGYLVLVDRIKDMIIRGGENLYPQEIESVLHDHPAVREAAVFGVPHDVLGEVPVAVVALRDGEAVTGEDLRGFLAGRLAAYKVPGRVDIVDAVPRNAVGKIDKPALRSAAVAS